MMFLKKLEEVALSIIFFFLLVSLLLGCDFKKKEEVALYRAINGKDTAFLSLSTSKNRFWGQYEVRYGKMGKDSGEVRGEYIGDTLRGVFKYLSFGGSLKQTPIALLKKDNKLILGKGVVSSLLDMPIYMSEIPIDYNNPEFVFEEINKSSKK